MQLDFYGARVVAEVVAPAQYDPGFERLRQ
jgi:hypothetical protein